MITSGSNQLSIFITYIANVKITFDGRRSNPAQIVNLLRFVTQNRHPARCSQKVALWK